MNQTTPVKLNLGCGLQCPEGWVNIDSSLGARLARRPLLKKILHSVVPQSWGVLPNSQWPRNVKYMNITRRFDYDDQSVDAIYSSHTIEHLTYSEAAFVFREAFRVLKSGGIIRIIVPHFAQTVKNYLANAQKMPHLAAKRFLDDTYYFEIPVPDNLPGLVKYYFKRKNNHHFLYDEQGLRHQLSTAGFTDILSMKWGESRIPGIEKIDIPERFAGAICLEGIRP